MAYPVWQIPGGNLGKIAANEYFELDLALADPHGSLSGSITALQINRTFGVSSSWGFHNGQIIFAASGLPYHSYGNSANPNIPSPQNYNLKWPLRAGTNSKSTYQIPVNLGAIGYWLNGVAMFSPSAATGTPPNYPPAPAGYNYNASYTSGQTLGYSFGEDLAGGHSQQDGIYHYHDYTFAIAWQSGSGNAPGSGVPYGVAEINSIPYLKGGLVHADGHSKILGFSLDGYPVYGPYGYTTPTNAASAVKRMETGYHLKPTISRSAAASNTAVWPMGIFVQDYEYIGTGDLDLHNGRYCVTPDYPQGTYAYFCTVDQALTPVYPYVIGNYFYNDPAVQNGNGNAPVTALPSRSNNVTYQLISGRLPPGLQLDDVNQIIKGLPVSRYEISGVAYSVSQDQNYKFTIRAINNLDKTVTDKGFSVTITGNYPPEILTTEYSLGDYLDGSYIDIAISAVDLNVNDVLTFSLEASQPNQLFSSGLPPGLALTSDGHITGVLEPVINPYPQESTGTISQTGLDNSQWNLNPYVFDPLINKRDYLFTIRVTDGKTIARHQYKMTVYNHSDLRTDNITIDTTEYTYTSDISNRRTPVLITQNLGNFSNIQSGEYFSFQLIAKDYDNDPIKFQLYGSNGGGWDADGQHSDGVQIGWDNDVWESSNFVMPPGLGLDENTGWITGLVEAQVVPTFDYNFGIRVVKADNPTIASQVVTMYTTVLGSYYSGVTWNTASDLGYVKAGAISNLSINAKANNGSELYYSLAIGSHMPQGLSLLPNGLLSGRPSFQTNVLDRGLTTIDKNNYSRGYQDNPTTFDAKYTLIVDVINFDQTVSSQKTFTMTILNETYEPYENLYVVCRPPTDKRELIDQLLINDDIFAVADVYRHDDPYFGTNTELTALTASGLTANQATVYANAMQKRHRDKPLYFGDFKYAIAKDASGTYLYDVIYVELIQDTTGDKAKSPADAVFNMSNKINGWKNPRVKDLPENQIASDTTNVTDDVMYVKTNDTWTAINTENLVYENDLLQMNNDIIQAVGVTNNYALPEWMNTIQPDGSIPGFVLCSVLAYMKPGTGAKTLYNLKKYIPFDIKLVPFIVDRYVWDHNLSQNFDLVNRKFYDKAYTTFDNYGSKNISYTPVATVDYAVDVPFDTLNQSGLNQLILDGGIDGVVDVFQDKTIIFHTQEDFNGYTGFNDGWNFPDSSVVPGYNEIVTKVSAINQRGGIWKINVVNLDVGGFDPTQSGLEQAGFDLYNLGGANNLIILTFVQELKVGDVVSVKSGNLHGGQDLKYTVDNMIHLGHTVPYFNNVKNVSTVSVIPTTFDIKHTRFVNNVDEYQLPLDGDTYLKFPQKHIFQAY